MRQSLQATAPLSETSNVRPRSGHSCSQHRKQQLHIIDLMRRYTRKKDPTLPDSPSESTSTCVHGNRGSQAIAKNATHAARMPFIESFDATALSRRDEYPYSLGHTSTRRKCTEQILGCRAHREELGKQKNICTIMRCVSAWPK